jgi:CO/xanthine dehydrogenase FAD-binding subunit
VQRVHVARERADLALGTPLGGGTWLYSEPQDATELVDLLGLNWEPVTRSDTHLSIAATCPIALLRELDDSPLFQPCADALLASWKVQRVATVGGNIALALPAGPMTALAVGLDATLTLWTATATRVVAAADFVTGVRSTVLAPGEVVRSIEFPLAGLAQPAAMRRIALSPLGRTGTLVTGRVDDAGVVHLGVTGGTERPHTLRSTSLQADLDAIDDWYDDAHGSPDWREAMTRSFAADLVEELS